MPIESDVLRVIAEVNGKLTPGIDDSPSVVPHTESYGAERLLLQIGEDATKLRDYLRSPDFATLAAQMVLTDKADSSIDDQLHHGLRLAGIAPHVLARTKTVLLMALQDGWSRSALRFADTHYAVTPHDHKACAAANGRLLAELQSLTEINAFATEMRHQVRKLHGEMRLPHIGTTKTVPYNELYVQPHLDHTAAPIPFGAPGSRAVVLGDPGAGKSTLAEKLTYDVAVEDSGRVPFLVVLREFNDLLRVPGTDVPKLLETLCVAPYHCTPPPAALQYLLRNGRAVVVFDGLDELVQTELRSRVVKMVTGFAHAYPLVPVVVTARKIGYTDAALNEKLFPIAYVNEFDEEQVLQYVKNWFALDLSAKPAVREQLPKSFMKESEDIAELRSNPLLLALLCTLYSSDRYLPNELSKVYERCALMLFEQWDKGREIPLPLEFRGHLREAVEHLAWNMFTAPNSGEALEESQIVRLLSAYLEPKLEDPVEASVLAEAFLRFCTGRAWVLNDVGATSVERRFGFTHRTFLEYFAARRLVRNNRSGGARQLWAVMGPRVEAGVWDVVGQIALQLYHDGTADGVDELLMTAVENDGLRFAARALGYVQPSRRTIRAITRAAVNRSLSISIENRTGYDPGVVISADDVLVSCARRSSPANRPIIEKTIEEELAGNQADISDLVRQYLRHEFPGQDRTDLRGRWWAAPYLVDGNLIDVHELVASFGPNVLFHSHQFHHTHYYAAAVRLSSVEQPDQSPRNALAELIIRSAVPWTTWLNLKQAYGQPVPAVEGVGHDALTALLCLPYLEHCADYGFDGVATMLPVQADLVWARYCRRVDLSLLPQLPELVRPYLTAWMEGQINVTGSNPLRPRRCQEPR
ncbi:NACHT domain-containing protein [Lentzea sp. BCCO 10_0856]|uniref:NACHT domain-containing protein n=1 Tax=Lentzea miocenica TaxID=3095431 RepID=A0ABU4T9Z1_9PSEU|nr:NACHT domain-containing protein [Lentzea sp. BCCO 10_0856]MDX8034986.1 NACHT domain-containing protein [Lentzea sp. BCCO 10_0856]